MPTRTPKKVVACPPKQCDICKDALKTGPAYYDVRIPRYGHVWGWCCDWCFRYQVGVKLGTGLGQKYDSRTDIKLEGSS